MKFLRIMLAIDSLCFSLYKTADCLDRIAHLASNPSFYTCFIEDKLLLLGFLYFSCIHFLANRVIKISLNDLRILAHSVNL